MFVFVQGVLVSVCVCVSVCDLCAGELVCSGLPINPSH